MPAELLEFEEPVGVLLKEIEALSMLPQTPERKRSIESLRQRADQIRGELYANLTPWQRVLVARHPNRPNTLDYIERLFTGWDELHGDRRFADDHAIVAGFASYREQPVCVVGHQKGRDTKQKIFRNFGYARPEGYRKALRVMQLAREVRPADHRLHRHAGRVSRHGIRGARRRRSDRRQPAGDDDDRASRSS